MAYCRECLGSIGTESLTCPHCGVRHPLAEPTALAHPTVPLPGEQKRIAGSTGGTAGGLLLAGMVVLLLLVAVLRSAPKAAAPAGAAQPAAVASMVEPESEPANGPWYRGGTLHHATASEWRAAAFRDKVATAADFVSATGRSSGVSRRLPEATALVSCIDREVLYRRDVDSRPVSEIAAFCLTVLK